MLLLTALRHGVGHCLGVLSIVTSLLLRLLYELQMGLVAIAEWLVDADD